MWLYDNQLIFGCSKQKKSHKKDFNKDLIKRFASAYEFYNRDINKFVLLLRKRVYPYEYIDSWGRFDETVLPNKKEFYSKLNLEDITLIIDMQREYIKNLIIKI